MSAEDGAEPIEDDEFLLRRISLVYYNHERDEHPAVQSFVPTKHDSTGLSLYRLKYNTLEEVAAGGKRFKDKGYYVAMLRAGDLREHGMEVTPDPSKRNRGHAEIRSLNFENRNSDESAGFSHILALKLCKWIKGPYKGG